MYIAVIKYARQWGKCQDRISRSKKQCLLAPFFWLEASKPLSLLLLVRCNLSRSGCVLISVSQLKMRVKSICYINCCSWNVNAMFFCCNKFKLQRIHASVLVLPARNADILISGAFVLICFLAFRVLHPDFYCLTRSEKIIARLKIYIAMICGYFESWSCVHLFATFSFIIHV